MNNPFLIGVTGPARAGKDTTADCICYEYGAHFYSFASPIKHALRHAFGLSLEELNGSLKESPLDRLGLDKSPRQLMQTLGTEWGRDCVDANVWLKLGMARWSEHCGQGQALVIADVRFQNEADFIRQHGHLIHISRPDAPEVAAHASEGGIETLAGDFSIVNDGSLEDLNNKLHQVMGRVSELRTKCGGTD